MSKNRFMKAIVSYRAMAGNADGRIGESWIAVAVEEGQGL
jgi:hypothetical protein